MLKLRRKSVRQVRPRIAVGIRELAGRSQRLRLLKPPLEQLPFRQLRRLAPHAATLFFLACIATVAAAAAPSALGDAGAALLGRGGRRWCGGRRRAG
eukprot:scaffold22966_cov65-Isochrysis_galbana.AAC.1